MKNGSWLILAALLFAACETSGGGESGATLDNTPALSSLEALFDGAPANDTIPEDGKFDATYPKQFDLHAEQSPVRSQGGRGTCSIFATVALMEHLYNLEGSLAEPDFSEQFLQWSAKVEVGAFPRDEGSNPQRNIEAIHRFGIVSEADEPYESRAWGTSDDPRCTGEDDQPTLCYTNGEPSAEALAARRWKLPAGRWVNCSHRSVKAYMRENGVGVLTSLEFFYQSWNHGGSKLPVNRDNFRDGWVLAPNAADITDSRERPAGHAVYLVGWDDEREAQKVDGEGKPLVDANGDPVMERGFFLFKNSWGTGSFGTRNPFGAGYGWVSMDYVRSFGSCYSSTVPEVELDAELCDNQRDDNLDGLTDCDDPMCAETSLCRPSALRFGSETPVAIPDDEPAGAASVVRATGEGTVDTARVTVDITHSYRGDLTLSLLAPDGRAAVLLDREGGSADDVKALFVVTGLAGSPLAGDWTLLVVDGAGQDTGTLNSWSVEFTLGGALPPELCDDGVDNDADGMIDCGDPDCAQDPACAEVESVTADGEGDLAIPDNDPEGVESYAEVTSAGTIADIRVRLNITHPYRGDLVVTLEHDSGRKVTLHDGEGGGEDDLVREYTPTAFVGGPAEGLWLLHVVDKGNLDVGTLVSWQLELVLR